MPGNKKRRGTGPGAAAVVTGPTVDRVADDFMAHRPVEEIGSVRARL